jgi:hypothetical protein
MKSLTYRLVLVLVVLNVLAQGAMLNVATPTRYMVYQNAQEVLWYALLVAVVLALVALCLPARSR